MTKTPRHEAIESVYSDSKVTLGISGREVAVHGVTFGDQLKLAKLFIPFLAAAATAGAGEAGIELAVTAMLDKFITDVDSVTALIQSMTGIEPAEQLALPGPDGVQLYEACLSKLRADDIMRFFQLATKLMPGKAQAKTPATP